MGAGGAGGGEDFAGEEDERGADEAGHAEEPETVHKAEERGLLKDDAGELRFGVEGGVRNGVAVRRKIVGQRSQPALVLRIEGSGMRD